MVEEAVVLVVVEDEGGLAPDLRVGRDGLDLPGDEVGARGGQVVRVLGLGAGGDDPGHRGEPVVAGVLLEGVGRELAHAALVQRVARLGVLEGLEVLQHVAAVVVLLLVDAPAHARLLEPLGVGGPPVRRGRRVVGDRAAPGAGRVDGAGHPVEPVGPGRAEDRTEVVVADGEGLGQRELERYVLPGVVAHHVRAVLPVRLAVRGQPAVHLPAVPRLVLDGPGVAGGGDRLGAALMGVQPERQQVPLGVRLVRLVEHRAPGGQPQRVGVGEAAYALEGAEVVVERPVLLHQQHDVLDVVQRAVPFRSGRHRLLHARRQQ